MCLILLAWRAHPDYPLAVAANRDEFFSRRTAAADYWEDAPDILAGRDLEAGGTWLGVTRQGRFAALTNFRDPARIRQNAPSRGDLVSRYLRGKEPPQAFLQALTPVAMNYSGFNLLFGDRESLWYFSNCGEGAGQLTPGIYGLSNHLLDTPWPKVARGKSALGTALLALPDEGPLFSLLRDDSIAPDHALPRTGISLEWERLLSAAFISASGYGTRSATVLLMDASGNARFIEQGFQPEAMPGERREFSFSMA